MQVEERQITDPTGAEISNLPEVLLVDDDLMNIEVLKAMLQMQNTECDMAMSGNQAVMKIKERIECVRQGSSKMYKIICLDYSMSGMDGPMTTKKIRELISQNEELNICAPYICCCTAYDEAAYKSQALAAGMDHYLTKPVTYEELKKLLWLLQE